MTANRYVTPRQAAEILAVSNDHVLALIRQGSLQATNVGRGKKLPRYRVSVKEIDAFMQRRQQRKAPTRTRRPSIMEGVPEYV